MCLVKVAGSAWAAAYPHFASHSTSKSERYGLNEIPCRTSGLVPTRYFLSATRHHIDLLCSGFLQRLTCTSYSFGSTSVDNIAWDKHQVDSMGMSDEVDEKMEPIA